MYDNDIASSYSQWSSQTPRVSMLDGRGFAPRYFNGGWATYLRVRRINLGEKYFTYQIRTKIRTFHKYRSRWPCQDYYVLGVQELGVRYYLETLIGVRETKSLRTPDIAYR